MRAWLDPSFLCHEARQRWHCLRHLLAVRHLWPAPQDAYFGCLECEREVARDPEQQALLYPDGYPDPESPLSLRAAREAGLV